MLSLQGYTPEERNSAFYSREDYARMRASVKYTVRFLKCGTYPPVSAKCTINFKDESDVCVRGLECFVDEFVSTHRKRMKESSMAVVFAFQNRNNLLGIVGSDSEEAMAQAYMLHTERAQHIAGRWGHFDALDAGTICQAPDTISIDC